MDSKKTNKPEKKFSSFFNNNLDKIPNKGLLEQLKQDILLLKERVKILEEKLRNK